MEEHACVRPNTCEGSRWTSRIAFASMKGRSPGGTRELRGLGHPQPGPSPPAEIPTEPPREPEEPSHDDLDDGMGTGDQLTVPEESGETVLLEGNQLCGRNGVRMTDSRFRSKSLTRKLPRALSPKGLVWRSPLTTNRRK